MKSSPSHGEIATYLGHLSYLRKLHQPTTNIRLFPNLVQSFLLYLFLALLFIGPLVPPLPGALPFPNPAALDLFDGWTGGSRGTCFDELAWGRVCAHLFRF